MCVLCGENKPGRYKTKVKSEFVFFFWKRGIEVKRMEVKWGFQL